MLKLFAVLLGGRAQGCNIELHDVVFIIANSLQDGYPNLIKKWFGESKRLHIDSYIELTNIEGYEVIISKKPSKNDISLFFINMGGYKKNHFGEIHEMGFFISKSKEAAIEKAYKALDNSIYEQHCDDKLNIIEHLHDDIILLNKVDNYYINLIENKAFQKPLDICSNYIRLDIPELHQYLNEK